MRVLNQITFEAKDDAEALKLASERLGKDAVILSTRIVRVGGFMGLFQRHALQVTAGILQDDNADKIKDKEKKEKDDATAKERLVAFQKLLEFKQATETRSSSSGGDADAVRAQKQNAAQTQDSIAKVIYSPATVTASNKNAKDFDSVHISQIGLDNMTREEAQNSDFYTSMTDEEGNDTLKLKEEVSHLSKRLDTILHRLEGSQSAESTVKTENNKFEPGIKGVTGAAGVTGNVAEDIENIYKRLLISEIDPNYARSLLQEYQEYQEYKGRVPFAKWLESKVKCASDNASDVLGGKKVMLFGPTGAGKTTTIAKLAAIKALWEHKNVLLLTSDTYRIAAVDQLRTYAKILGVPIEVIFEVENFAHILAEHNDAELILLDTAGRGQKDRKNLEAFEVLYDVFKPDAVHLVLAANMKYKDMMDVAERMSGVPISHVIFTKLDETVSYGALFNMVRSLDKPISFFTTGQNVPNDIEVASGARLATLLMGDEVRSNIQ